MHLQAQKIANDTIQWQIDRYSILSELGRVNIEVKQGRDVKNALITKIDTSRNKIEYYSEGTLHDLFMNKIIEITPTTPHQYALYFIQNKYPIIKRKLTFEAYEDCVEFKYYIQNKTTPKIEKPISVIPPKKDSSIETKDTALVIKTIPVTDPTAKDLIIFPGGKQLAVKILEITNETVSYKRADLMDGPVYKILLIQPETNTPAQIITNSGRTIIDYNKKP